MLNSAHFELVISLLAREKPSYDTVRLSYALVQLRFGLWTIHNLENTHLSSLYGVISGKKESAAKRLVFMGSTQ